MRYWILLLGVLLSQSVLAADDFDDEYDAKSWREVEVKLPVAPKDASLLPFYVSAVTTNRFFVDGSSIEVGADGVVRYVLVVLSSEGAKNVTFEGMRCETRERRIYAAGRSDGSWVKFKSNQWEKIRDAVGNRHHAALFLEYFCPGGNIVRDTTEAINWLKKGGYAPGGGV